MTTTNRVATTILEQLGGAEFAALTGATRFVAGGNLLQFCIGSGAKDGINKVRIVLEPNDTYTMTFYRIRGADMKHFGEYDYSDVYCDQLQDIFERVTGFWVTLRPRKS